MLHQYGVRVRLVKVIFFLMQWQHSYCFLVGLLLGAGEGLACSEAVADSSEDFSAGSSADSQEDS